MIKSSNYISMSNSLLSLFLPSDILDYFEIVNHETIQTDNDLYTQKLTIYLEEKLRINVYC